MNPPARTPALQRGAACVTLTALALRAFTLHLRKFPFMKTRSTRSLRRLLFKIRYYCDYTEQIGQLEKVLARKPQKLQLDIIGSGDLSPDIALLIRSVFLSRSPRTHLITNARSSLQDGAVLIWLMGDTRLIRDDAKLYFRKSNKEEDDEDGEDWKKKSEDSEMDLEEADYEQVLQHIDNFLPVKELAGRPLTPEVLRQFGLVDNEKMDQFLVSAFAGDAANTERAKPGVDDKQEKQASQVSKSDQAGRSE